MGMGTSPFPKPQPSRVKFYGIIFFSNPAGRKKEPQKRFNPGGKTK
jgi:hypothetical protein